MINRTILFLLFALACSSGAYAQSEDQRLTDLDVRVSKVERRVRQLSSQALVLFLFGVVCALWAQNSGRSSWLWFFLGLFFSVFTVLVLLFLNAQDRQKDPPTRKPFDLQEFRKQ